MSPAEPETQEAFKFSILAQFYVAMHENVPDNYDAARYSFDGVDRSEQFVLREHIFSGLVFHQSGRNTRGLHAPGRR